MTLKVPSLRGPNNNNPRGRISNHAGYDGKIVSAFLQTYVTKEATQRDTGKTVCYLNGKRLSADDGRRLRRFATQERVSLTLTDAYLLRHGLMLWELEAYAEEHYGWNGYVEPLQASPRS